MSPLQPHTKLQCSPNLWFCTGPGGDVQVFVKGEAITCDPCALSVISYFTTPRTLAEVAEAAGQSPGGLHGWKNLMSMSVQLYDLGVLMDASDVSEDTGDENAAGGPGTYEGKYVNPVLQVEVIYKTKLRHREAKSGKFTMRDQPELCRLLVEVASGELPAREERQVAPHLLDRLVDVGVLVGSEDEPEKVHFDCKLDVDLLRMTPDGGRGSVEKEGSYIINGGVRFGAPEGPLLMDRTVSQFGGETGGDYELICVDDPCTKIAASYWLDERRASLVRDLLAGQRKPSELSEDDFDLFAQAHIVVPGKTWPDWVEAREQALTRLEGGLRTRQHAVIRDVIHPLHLAALRKYIRDLDRAGFLLPDTMKGAEYSSTRQVMHNDTVARFLHQQLCPLINRLTGDSLKASYSCVSVYKNRARLPPHLDRAQCAWNVSLLIDTEPELSLEESWPIFLDVGGEVSKIRLGMGDAVLYPGTKIPHWRDALPEGQTATLLLLHFVPQDFNESLN